MADNNNDQNQNNNQNQNKNKGGGGGGSQGLTLGAKFDATAPGSLDNLKQQAAGHAANSLGFIGGMLIAAVAMSYIKQAFNIKDVTPGQQQGGGGAGIQHPGQIVKAISQLKDHKDMSQYKDKIKEALGE